MTAFAHVAAGGGFTANSAEKDRLALKRLPLSVQRKIAAWRRISEDQSAANEAASAAHWAGQVALKEKISTAQVHLNAFARERARGGGVRDGTMRTGPHGPEVTADAVTLEDKARERLAELKDQLQRLTKRGASLPVFPPTPNLDLRPIFASTGKWVEFAPPLPIFKKGETPESALRSLRLEIAERTRELRGVDKLPLTLEEGLAHAIREINEKCASGAVDWSRCMRMYEVSASPNVPRRQGTVAWPKTYMAGDGPDGVVELPNGLALAVYLNREVLIEKARKQLGELAQPERALALNDRPQRKADLAAAILAAERIEQTLLDAVHADGGTTPWRHDASALAVLGIVAET